MNPLSKAAVAWVAGVIEGEGSIILKPVSARPGAPRNVPYVKVTMNDEDIIRRLQTWTGFGTVFSYKNKSGTTAWTWQSAKRDEVPALLRAIRPWMGERRRAKIDEVLAGAEPYGYKPRSVRHIG